jgi:hypothetical protein
MLVAKTIVNNGIISANGGNGANGVAGNSGGGGGGGGGWVVTVSGSFTGNVPTASGGALGTFVGTGSTSGAVGGPGTVLQFTW